MAYQNEPLQDNDIREIIREVALIRQNNSLDSAVCLRDGVFKILDNTGTLIFYPFEGENLWGIYIYKDEKNFYIINSGIEREKQVFAAAHELAHSLEIAKVAYETVTPELMMEYTNHSQYGDKIIKADKIANRFAAELMVGDKALKELFYKLPKYYKLLVKTVILSGEFLVPYKAIVKRLEETGIIDKAEMNKLLEIKENEIKLIAERYECCTGNYGISKEKLFGGYANKALTMYENDLYTYNDLKKKLELIGKTPEDYDIQFYDIDLSEFILRASEDTETEYGADE